MFLLSGALFPVTGLPSILQGAVYLDPLTYGVDVLRHIILGYGAIPIYIDVIVIIVFAMVMILAAAFMFSWREQELM